MKRRCTNQGARGINQEKKTTTQHLAWTCVSPFHHQQRAQRTLAKRRNNRGMHQEDWGFTMSNELLADEPSEPWHRGETL